MTYKITTLAENTIGHGGKNLIGEHGLSFHVQAGERRILFDTGQNLGIANNAAVLGVDLSRIDTVVFSHGHYDHTGGLKSLLACNHDFTVCAHPEIFGLKVRDVNTNYKYIGIPIEKNQIEASGVNLKLSKLPQNIAPGISTTGEIPFETDFEQVESGYFVKTQEEVVADNLPDDQALILATSRGLVVLLGCSHRGVVNTLNHVVNLTGKNTIHAILGGLHLGKASDSKLQKIIAHLRGFNLQKIGVGHCTGYRAMIALANEFKDRVFLNAVGSVLEF